MNPLTARQSSTGTITTTRRPARDVHAAYAAYGPGGLTDPAPVTGGRGLEVDDVVELLAELRFLQELGRLS